MTDRLKKDTPTGSGSPKEQAPGLPSFWTTRRFMPVAILLFLGILFFVTLFILVRTYERNRQEDIFRRVAQARILAFARRADNDLAALLSIGHFFAASRQVEQNEFDIFAQGPLGWHTEIESLEWVPRVPADQRENFELANDIMIKEEMTDGKVVPADLRTDYYPILYQATKPNRSGTIGLDLGAHWANREAIQAAITASDGNSVSTGRILNYFGETNAPVPGVRVFLPIYLKAPEGGSTRYHPTNLLGFAAALLRPAAMLRQSQSTRETEQLDICLFDHSSSGRATLLDFESPDASYIPPHTIQEGDYLKEPFTESAKITIAGRDWTLVCKPSIKFSKGMNWEGWSVLLGGLLLTILLGSYLYTLLGQTAYIENVVTRRTRELASMNVQLQNEIAERERGDRRLRDSEALYHSLVDTVPMNIARKNLKGEVTFGNKRYCDNLGRTMETVLGKTDYDFFPKEMADKYVSDDRKVIESGKVFEDVEAHRRGDGTMGYMQVLKAPVMDASGEVVGTQVIFWDVTEKKKAEEDLKMTLQDLARSNRDLEQFAYVASHDLQEPLRMVASYTELLAKRYRDTLDGEAKEFIDMAVEGSVRMKQLIDDLLAYSRLGTRGAPFTRTESGDALKAALTNLQISIDENCALVTNDSLPVVYGDHIQLTQLFQNLIANAIKFAGDNAPKIHLSAGTEGEEWVFSVKDNGIGIQPEHAERIFVIFQRLHHRDQYPGTGIGLAICKKIVERHGGRIWVESKPGTGSTFFFTLPTLRKQ